MVLHGCVPERTSLPPFEAVYFGAALCVLRLFCHLKSFSQIHLCTYDKIHVS